MPFVPLRNVVGRVLKQWKVEAADVQAYGVFDRWEEIVGDKVAGKARPVRITEHRLYIEVDDPMWLSQLRFMKLEILEKIGTALKKGLITDVRFFLKGFS